MYLRVSYSLCSSGQVSITVCTADACGGIGPRGSGATAGTAYHAGITAAVSTDTAGAATARHAPLPAITCHAGTLPWTVLTDVAPHLNEQHKSECF